MKINGIIVAFETPPKPSIKALSIAGNVNQTRLKEVMIIHTKFLVISSAEDSRKEN